MAQPAEPSSSGCRCRWLWPCGSSVTDHFRTILTGLEGRSVGGALGRELFGYFSARRGAYRVIHRIDDETRVVHLVRIEHRADVYRPR